MNLEEVQAKIAQLDHEREEIYKDDKVIGDEHPRLKAIEHELAQLWDLRRRIEAAKSAGLNEIPVPPPPDAENLIG